MVFERKANKSETAHRSEKTSQIDKLQPIEKKEPKLRDQHKTRPNLAKIDRAKGPRRQKKNPSSPNKMAHAPPPELLSYLTCQNRWSPPPRKNRLARYIKQDNEPSDKTQTTRPDPNSLPSPIAHNPANPQLTQTNLAPIPKHKSLPPP